MSLDHRYHCSEEHLERALRSIPLGSQTFSKSITQYPVGAAPLFLQRGDGSRVWDLDGHQYIDFVNSLAAITLGYNDPDVNAAVRHQLDEAVILSLPHTLEAQVAEQIIAMVPCAEKVRFGKNGSDATAGAIRVARAHTGRDHVAACGYHGWQDWYIGSTLRNKGVPQAVRDLTHTFAYNDLASLEKVFAQWPHQIAAVILEPMNVAYPAANYLAQVKELAHKHGALLIFDETITGFRFANGGAQELFGVVPDLATFGKGLANGYPVSAIAGRSDVMQQMEEIFFSFTFGGELLSLAAAHATLHKLQTQPVLRTLTERGTWLLARIQDLIAQHTLGSVLSTAGHPSWSFLLFADHPSCSQWTIKTLFLQEVFARGILAIGTHNLSYAHSEQDLQRLLDVYDEVFGIISEALLQGNAEARLRCKPLIPLFRVR